MLFTVCCFRLNKAISLFLSSILVLLLCSCSYDPTPKPKGIWKCDHPESTVEFADGTENSGQDGDGHGTMMVDGETVDVVWVWMPAWGRVLIHYDIDKNSGRFSSQNGVVHEEDKLFVGKFKLTGDTLTLTSDSGEVWEFYKVKENATSKG